MMRSVETFTPTNTMKPLGPYSHIAKVGPFVSIGGVAGVNPATGQLAGPGAYAQTEQIIESFRLMLESIGADLSRITHINIFLVSMADYEEMNRAYAAGMGDHRPARTVVGVSGLPKPGARLTMNLTAITHE